MNVTQVQIVNTPEEPTVFMLIVIGIILLVGFILFLIGYSGTKPSVRLKVLFSNLMNKQRLKFLGIAILIFGVGMLFVESSQLREHFVALAVVVATVVAATSLNESMRLRKESNALQMKERLEKGLDEIHSWSIRVMEHITIASRFAANPQDVVRMIMDCRAEMTIDVAASISIQAIANELTANPHISPSDRERLATAVADVDHSLRDFNTSLFELQLDALTLDSLEEVVNKVADLTTKLRELLTISSHIAFT